MTAAFVATCSHPRLRATEPLRASETEDGSRWMVSCTDCGHRQPVTGAEYRRRMRGSRRAPVLVGDEGGDSGRYTSLACLG